MKFPRENNSFGRFAIAAAVVMAMGTGPAHAAKATPEAGPGQDIVETLLAAFFPSDGPTAPSKAPGFRVVPDWPQPLPNNWQVGQIAGIGVDANDNIWVLNRPRTLTSDEAGATDALDGVFVCNPGGVLVGESETCAADDAFPNPVPADAFGHPRPNGPISDCCIPAPAVLQFDPDGNLLRAWGGPAERDPAWNWPENTCETPTCQWPANEHGLHVDEDFNIYIGGNGFGDGTLASARNDRGWDGQILKFSADGTFLLQIGEAGATAADSNDTDGGLNGTPQLWRPADSEAFNGDLYIADGYGNHRVIVVDAETGQYERHWGAYGTRPVDDAAADSAGPFAEDRDAVLEGTGTPDYFRNPVHCVRVADDGTIYVCDRPNNRIQVFDQDAGTLVPCDNTAKSEGTCGFVTEKFLRADTLGPGSVWDLDTSSDAQQSCLHNVDGSNQHLDTLLRSSLEVLDTIGRNGRLAGEFHWVHNVAVDSRGNIYTAEVDTGKRAQKFRRIGRRGCRN